MMEGQFDSILRDVDEFGTYTKLLLVFVLIPAFVPVGFHAYNQLFMSATPDHYCRIPYLENLNYTEEFIKNISIPLEYRDGLIVFSQCNMFDVDEGTLLAQINVTDALKIYEDTDQYPIVPCKYGWKYDLSMYKSTTVTEWNTVCDLGYLPTFALVVLGLSGIIGTFVFGTLQDRIGRRPPYFIYLSLQFVFGIGTGYAKDFWVWLIMRMGVGFTVPALMNGPMVLATEIVPTDMRALAVILLNIGYSLTLMALAGVAYLFRDWRDLAFATTLPFLLLFSLWRVLPESPRWLFANGKLERTEKILRLMAYINGRTLPSDYKQTLQAKYLEKVTSDRQAASLSQKVEGESFGFADLFRGNVLRRNTLIITFIWFATMGVYVGLSYYAPVLDGDEYRNFFLAGLAELPTYCFLLPVLNRWGRRWTLFSSLVLGGVACICTIMIAHKSWLTLVLYCVGKFGVSAGFCAITLMAMEIYPTVVCGLGLCFSTEIGMIGPALVPLVHYMGQEYLYLPLLCLGALMVLGGFAALGLPETLGRSLPQTLGDAEQYQVDCSLGSCCPKGKLEIRRRIGVNTGSECIEDNVGTGCIPMTKSRVLVKE